MPERCSSRCSMVTASSTSGRSSPSTERAVVSRSASPLSTSRITVSAVNVFVPLAIAKRVVSVFATPCARSASPYAAAQTVVSPSVTVTTPEKSFSVATASIAAPRSSMGRTLFGDPGNRAADCGVQATNRLQTAGGRGGHDDGQTQDLVGAADDGRGCRRAGAGGVVGAGRRVRRTGGRERDDPTRAHHDPGRVSRGGRALRHVVRVHRRGQGGGIHRPAPGDPVVGRTRRRLDVAAARAGGGA